MPPMPPNAAAMAGGGAPPMPPQQGMPPPQQGMTTAAPGNTMTTDVSEILNALKEVIQQCVDQQGRVDINRLVTIWPQFSKVPFQVVMQLIEQNPDLIDELISQYGLNGLVVNGQAISAEQLVSMAGSGAAAPGGGV